MDRYIIGRKSDVKGVADAVDALGDPQLVANLTTGAPVLLHGILSTEGAVFVGIPKPLAGGVNLNAPEPVDGRADGWLYFREVGWAAYTEDLVAVRIPPQVHSG